MSNVDINVDRRTDRRTDGPTFRHFLANKSIALFGMYYWVEKSVLAFRHMLAFSP